MELKRNNGALNKYLGAYITGRNRKEDSHKFIVIDYYYKRDWDYWGLTVLNTNNGKTHNKKYDTFKKDSRIVDFADNARLEVYRALYL